ncbi:MAG TPA: NAD(P)-dependent oxidoreductase [Dehalococcoidia bacterium]|nr:NAD(P)-dependent oxidoreductase [Dehalococcoidia bacterium]
MSSNQARVLVTGGAGRLGITVCRAFLGSGYRVRLFDLDTARNRKAVKELPGEVEVFWGDVTQKESVSVAAEYVDAIVHMAAVLPPLAYQNPELARHVNVEGTGNIIDVIKEKGGNLPLVFTSSAAVFGPSPEATEPVSPEKDTPHPEGVYAETKLQAENLIREAGIDHVILRLTATMYLLFEVSDMKRMLTVPLKNRIEFCHLDDTALAILSAVKNFDLVKGNTFVISGGPGQRMYYQDMIGGILKVLGLPMPPADKFTKEPYYLDWYDTGASQLLLQYQRKTFADYLDDYREELTRRFSPLFLPFMRYFVGPLFGWLIVRLI